MEPKVLHPADRETGMKFAQAYIEAKQQLLLAESVLDEFVSNLRKRYDASADGYELNNWAVGFEPIDGGE